MLRRFRDYLARRLAPSMLAPAEAQSLIETAVARAMAARPINVDYDPKGEGYRRLDGALADRDLAPMHQARMFEIAYYMWDASPMTRRLARMDKAFLFAEPVSITTDDDKLAAELDKFWDRNRMDLSLPERIMWLGLLGEQCWPVEVNPHNGDVDLGYVDPAGIRQVYVSPVNVERVVRVDLVGSGGRPGKKLPVVRRDNNPLSTTYGRQVGECFFVAINHPPNSPRGRSDYLTLFDWIDGLERYGYNYLERAEFLLNFVWDVELEGMNEEEIREWLRSNPPPDPGSLRAHNERVKWSAVAPDIKASDFRGGFDMGKSFVMGAAGRPDAWFGGGGKIYQTEADQLNEVPIKDLDERQLYVEYLLTDILEFVRDQKIVAGALPPTAADATITVNMPEISKKDLARMINGVPQLTQALSLATENRWVSNDTAARTFLEVLAQISSGVDVGEELDKLNDLPPEELADYGNVPPPARI